MNSVSKWLSRAALWLSALGLMIMTLIIGWQVFGRYVLGDTPAWGEQAALLLMLWFIPMAAAAGVREGFHIRISLLQDMSDGWVQFALALASHLVVLAFGIAMAVYGWQLTDAVWRHVIPTLEISRGWAYVPLVFAGALIAFFAAEHAIATLRGKEVEPQWS